MSQQFQHLEPDEIVSVAADITKKNALIPSTTFQVKEFVEHLLSKFGSSEEIVKTFVYEGIDCQVLKLASGWAKGKVKLTLEFYPDEAEIPQKSQGTERDPFPLDDLRKELNQ